MRLLTLARRAAEWLLRPPDFGALVWPNTTHLGLDEDDA